MAKKNRWLGKLGLVGRPTNTAWQGSYKTSGVLQRTQEVPLYDIYELARKCNAVRKSIQSLRDYLFKEGIEWEKEFSKQCTQCKYKHPVESRPDKCVQCGWTVFKEPVKNEVDRATQFFKRVNRNGETLMDTLKKFEEHLNVADDAYMIMAKEYEVDKEGDIIGWRVKELYVPDTLSFNMVQDMRTQIPGGLWYICLLHRPTSRTPKEKSYFGVTENGKVYNEPGRCDICNRKLYDVWYISAEKGGVPAQQISTASVGEFYLGDVVLKDGRVVKEVVHASKYDSSYGYGYSPIISIWNMAQTLVYMETYARRFYEEERTPRSAIFVPTNNPNAVRSTWKEAEDRNVSQGGHYIPKFTYDPGQTAGSRPVQYIEFSKLPQELQMLEQSDYYYRRIGSAFGVAPVFHGNVDSVGMSDAGPTQWQVTVLAAQIGQAVYNDKVFPALVEQLGVKDWVLRLKSVEEKDEAQDVQLDIMKAQHAQIMGGLGFAPKERDMEGNFVFNNEPAAPMGQDGMMPGDGQPEGQTTVGQGGQPPVIPSQQPGNRNPGQQPGKPTNTPRLIRPARTFNSPESSGPDKIG